jgi:hypothetical protein
MDMKMSDVFTMPMNCSVEDSYCGWDCITFGDGNITNKMAIAVDLAINNHDRLVDEVTTKDEQIKNLVGILELCVSGMNEAMIMEGLDFYDELHAASELLSKIKDTKL